MIENPQCTIENFVKAGANIISVHVEEGYHLDRTLNQIRELGAKPGVVLNPATPVSSVASVLDIVDVVLLMSVNPGFGGQSFIPYTKKKIKELRELIDAGKKKILIEVDGGIKTGIIGELSRLGADVFVAGSAIFQSGDYRRTIEEMKKQIKF